METEIKEGDMVRFYDSHQSLPYYIDNEIMESFDVQFEYNGKKYQLALIQSGKVNGVDFKLHLN